MRPTTNLLATLFVVALIVVSGLLVVNQTSRFAPVQMPSTVALKPSGSVHYSEAQLLDMTPIQLANMGVPGVVIGSGPSVASGASPAASADAQRVYGSLVAVATDLGATSRLPVLERLPISTVEAYQTAYQNVSEPFSALFAATLSIIATADAMHIVPAFSPTDWWILGGVACGATVAGIALILAAATGVAVLTAGLGSVILVAAAFVAAVACTLSVAVLTGFLTHVKQVGDQKTYNEGVINKSFAGYTNDIEQTQTQANQFYAELPFMQYALYRLADEAALTQIANTTFNPVLNLMQSGILQGFADAQFVALIGGLNQALQLMIAQANSLTVSGHHGDTFQWNGIVLPNGTQAFGVSGGPLFVNAADQNSTLLMDYYAPSASAPSCPLGAGGPETLPTLTPIPGTSSGWSVSSTAAKGCVAGPHAAIQTFAGDYAGSAAINGTGGIGSATGGYGGYAATLLATDGVPFCPTSGYCPQVANNTQYEVFPARGTGINGGSMAGFTDSLTGNVVNNTLVNTNLVSTAYNNFGSLEINAVANAKLYWAFLRSQGITTPTNVPAKYILVIPAQLMSDGVCVDNVSIYGGTGFKGPCLNLNYNQSYSLYLAWLYDLGVFNATTYQQTNPVSCGSAGACTYWGNVNLFGFGSVYIPGVAPQNTSYGSEVFSNPATWAMINTQLLFFPQALQSDTIGVYNASWEVPVAAPLAVYGTADGLFEPLTGNGTLTGTAISGSAAGAAINLNYCELYKKNVSATSGQCTAYPYTVNYTIQLLLCGADAQNCFTTPTFATAGSCDWFQFQQFLGALGTLSCAVAWVLDIIVIIALVYIVYLVVRWVIENRGPRRMYMR